MGRELQRRKLAMPKTIWSAAALTDNPDAVRDIHISFISAGADVITTNNYAVVPRLLATENIEHRLAELTELAITLAQEARRASGRHIRIAGSLPPLDTSYRPDKVGPPDQIEAIYRDLAELLAPGVDILLCETMSSAVEARAAACAAADTGKPVWVSWTLDDAANGCLRSGETVAVAYAALKDLSVEAFLFNCCSPESISQSLPTLRLLTGKAVGAYANALQTLPQDYEMGARGEHPARPDITPQVYLRSAKQWRDAGADIIGGCCGIGPEHIAVLRRAFN